MVERENDLKVYYEHEEIKDQEILSALEQIKILPNNFKLIDKEELRRTTYFVGAQWLNKEIPVIVYPKIKNIDFVKILLSILSNPITLKSLNEDNRDIYGISMDEPPITMTVEDFFDVTPFIILHFIFLVKDLVKKGMKREYVFETDNLSSKIKGKILMSQNIRRNMIKGSYHQNYCRFQILSEDIPENRIIKKALVFSQVFFSKIHKSNSRAINDTINYLLSYFKGVSDCKNPRNVSRYIYNPFFKYYKKTLKLARMILKRFDYSITNFSMTDKKIQPFYINMPLLFEYYFYSKITGLMKTKNLKIIYQFKGNKNKDIVDFLAYNNLHKIIIDTKYKLSYSEGEEIEDIRQLSGYSRDIKVLKKLYGKVDKNKCYTPICIIVYPDDEKGYDLEDSENTLDNILDNLERHVIKGFFQFYKIPVKLPVV